MSFNSGPQARTHANKNLNRTEERVRDRLLFEGEGVASRPHPGVTHGPKERAGKMVENTQGSLRTPEKDSLQLLLGTRKGILFEMVQLRHRFVYWFRRFISCSTKTLPAGNSLMSILIRCQLLIR